MTLLRWTGRIAAPGDTPHTASGWFLTTKPRVGSRGFVVGGWNRFMLIHSFLVVQLPGEPEGIRQQQDRGKEGSQVHRTSGHFARGAMLRGSIR